jgi:hypothetical protein
MPAPYGWFPKMLPPFTRRGAATQSKSFWSVRTELGYRALGLRPKPDLVVWHWIGPHAEYDKLIEARLAKKK